VTHRTNHYPDERGFQGVLTVATEVGWLLPFSFQFYTRLAAVFAEEGGGFGFVPCNRSRGV